MRIKQATNKIQWFVVQHNESRDKEEIVHVCYSKDAATDYIKSRKG